MRIQNHDDADGVHCHLTAIEIEITDIVVIDNDNAVKERDTVILIQNLIYQTLISFHNSNSKSKSKRDNDINMQPGNTKQRAEAEAEMKVITTLMTMISITETEIVVM